MKRVMVVALLLCLSTVPAQASDLRAAGQKYFGDIELVDQNGKKVRFYTDLIDGRIVVINSFFATCSGICPVMGGTFKKIQEIFGDRIGKDVFLVSISVDAESDTPAVLRKYAKANNARPGWTFITGDKKNVDAALRKLGLLTENKESHTPVMLIGNDATGVWKKAFGIAKSDEIVRLVQEVAAAK